MRVIFEPEAKGQCSCRLHGERGGGGKMEQERPQLLCHRISRGLPQAEGVGEGGGREGGRGKEGRKERMVSRERDREKKERQIGKGK